MHRDPSGLYLLDKANALGHLVNHDNCADRMALSRRRFIRVSALSTLSVEYWSTEVSTGNGELGFDSGEGA